MGWTHPWCRVHAFGVYPRLFPCTCTQYRSPLCTSVKIAYSVANIHFQNHPCARCAGIFCVHADTPLRWARVQKAYLQKSGSNGTKPLQIHCLSYRLQAQNRWLLNVLLCVHLAHFCWWHYPNSHPFQSHNELTIMGTEIPFLARRWKHLSSWPLSRDELTLWQVGLVFSSVSPVLLLSMSRIYLTPPDFWIFMKTLSYPARRLVCSLSGLLLRLVLLIGVHSADRSVTAVISPRTSHIAFSVQSIALSKPLGTRLMRVPAQPVLWPSRSCTLANSFEYVKHL